MEKLRDLIIGEIREEFKEFKSSVTVFVKFFSSLS